MLNKILLENERVKVQNTTFQPGERAPLHHHPDTVVYTLKAGKLTFKTNEKIEAVSFEKDKATYFTQTTHEVENTGSTTVDLIVIELK